MLMVRLCVGLMVNCCVVVLMLVFSGVSRYNVVLEGCLLFFILVFRCCSNVSNGVWLCLLLMFSYIGGNVVFGVIVGVVMGICLVLL